MRSCVVKKMREITLTKILLKKQLKLKMLILCLLLISLTSCQSVYTSECLWYTPPKDEQLLEIAFEYPELFKTEAQNKLKYEEICE
jgi:hypothetical protein